MLHKSLRDTLANVEQLIEEKEAEAFFAAWEPEEPEAPPASASQASGRLDGSDNACSQEHRFSQRPWKNEHVCAEAQTTPTLLESKGSL